MKRLSIKLMTIVGAILFLTSCGDDGSGSRAMLPYIFAELNGFGGPNSSIASVYVSDNSNANPITDAVVTINGVTLTYNATQQEYQGNLIVAPGDSVVLSVTAVGKTFI